MAIPLEVITNYINAFPAIAGARSFATDIRVIRVIIPVPLGGVRKRLMCFVELFGFVLCPLLLLRVAHLVGVCFL